MTKRDEYVEKLKKQLDEWNQDLDKLEAKVSELSGPMRAKLEPHLAKARSGAAAAREKLREVRTSGEESWEELTDDVERVWKALKQSINYFKSQL